MVINCLKRLAVYNLGASRMFLAGNIVSVKTRTCVPVLLVANREAPIE